MPAVKYAHHLIIGAAAIAATVFRAPPAYAYVRYQTSSGLPFYWPQTCVPMVAYPNDLLDLTPDQTMHAAGAAAAVWGADQLACTFLRIAVTRSDGTAPPKRYDMQSSLVFRRDWCAPDPASGFCTYDPATLALTSVFASTTTGMIRDADIEVNAKYFVWTDFDVAPMNGAQDLQNALAHEMGHLIGLDHTCYVPGATPPLDNTGQPVPSCDVAPAPVRETTMFPSAVPGDVSKRTLAPDDIQAVCDIYPKSQDPMLCPDAGAGAGGAGDAGAADIDGSAPPPADAAGAAGHAGGGTADGAADRGGTAGSGCGCDVSRDSRGARAPWWLGVATLLAGRRRRGLRRGEAGS